jgi:hypothetical protein
MIVARFAIDVQHLPGFGFCVRREGRYGEKDHSS